MILFLHNRYRTTGGEERAVDDLLWLVREHLGEDARLLERDSAGTSSVTAAAGLVRGGLRPGAVAAAVRESGARVVHAHNLQPTLGWRALAAAREAGARTVLHLHNYRLVCAVGTCIASDGRDCIRCQGRATAPGVRLNCRGSLPEAAAYAASLAMWQRRLTAAADAVVVPSEAALGRLRELRAPLPEKVWVVPHLVRAFATAPSASRTGYALVTSRLAREKDIPTAIEATRIAGIDLVIAGDGPLRVELERAAGDHVRFVGRVGDDELAALRAGARVVLCPSTAHETFGLAALEALATGVPVVASRVGALADLGPDAALTDPGDAAAMAAAIGRVVADEKAPARAIAAARRRAGPERVAPLLRAVYDG